MNPRRLRGFTAVLTAASANAVVAAVLGVITARSLGPSGQGTLTAATTCVAIASIAATLGTGVSLRLRSTPAPAPDDIRAFAGLSALMAAGGGAVAAVLFVLLGLDATSPALVGGILAFGATSIIARQVAEVVQAYDRVAASILSVGVGVVVQIAAFAAFVVAGRASVGTAVLCGIVGALAQGAFGLAAIRRFSPPARPSWAPARWGELIRHGSPNVAQGLGLIAIQRLDRLFIAALVGASAAGVYAVAATVAETARVVSTAVGQLLFVRTASARAYTVAVRRVYLAGLALQVAALAVLAATAPVVVPAVFGDGYGGAVPLVQGLAVAELFGGLAAMDSRILLGLNRIKVVSALTVAALGLAIPLYALLISRYSSTGAVYASIAVYSAYGLALVRTRRRAVPAPVVRTANDDG